MEKQKSETHGQTYTKSCNTCGEDKTLENFTKSKMHNLLEKAINYLRGE